MWHQLLTFRKCTVLYNRWRIGNYTVHCIKTSYRTAEYRMLNRAWIRLFLGFLLVCFSSANQPLHSLFVMPVSIGDRTKATFTCCKRWLKVYNWSHSYQCVFWIIHLLFFIWFPLSNISGTLWPVLCCCVIKSTKTNKQTVHRDKFY